MLASVQQIPSGWPALRLPKIVHVHCVAGDNNIGVGPFGTGSSGNAVQGGAGGDGGDNNGNTANGGDFNSGDFSGNGGIAAGNNGNGGDGGAAVGGEYSFDLCAVCPCRVCNSHVYLKSLREAAGRAAALSVGHSHSMRLAKYSLYWRDYQRAAPIELCEGGSMLCVSVPADNAI